MDSHSQVRTIAAEASGRGVVREMPPAFAPIVEQVERERSLLRAKANKLEGELAVTEEQLARLDKAAAALIGAVLAADGDEAAKLQVRKKSSKPRRPAVGRSQVAAAMEQVLRKVAVLEAVELRKQVENQLTAAGFSRMGFSLRFNEALKDSRFVSSPDGVRLKVAPEAVS